MKVVDITGMDKDSLSKFAIENFGLKLDLRKPINELVDLVNAESEKTQLVDEVAVDDKPKFILNRDTGKVFPWTEELRAYLQNAIACDENGKPV